MKEKRIYPVRNSSPKKPFGRARLSDGQASAGAISNRICLDYAASTPMDPSVFRAMEPYFKERYGNPGSLHRFGQEALAAVDKARESVACALGAQFREIIFTGSATEANNLALRGVVKTAQAQAAAAQTFSRGTERSSAPAAEAALDLSATRLRKKGGDQARVASETFRSKTSEPLRVIVSSIEHESVLETARNLSAKGGSASGGEKDGVEVVYLPVNREGVVDLKKLDKELNERTVLVSIMYANNEIGTIQPITEIAKIISRFKEAHHSGFPLFHTDAVQAFQYLDCNVTALGVDLMTLSAHKIYGPKGIGVLYVKNLNEKPHFLYPLLTGGGQEFGFRSGTENVPLIAGFEKAVELAVKNREKEMKRVSILKEYFLSGLKKIFSAVEVNGVSVREQKNVLPNILNVYFPKKNAEELLIDLDIRGVAVSSGAACSMRSSKPSHVLHACGYSSERARSSLRFSMGKYTTREEVKKALQILKLVLTK